MNGDWHEAVEEYFEAEWSLFELEVLAHHFVSPEPFPRSQALGYPGVVKKLRSRGLMEKRGHEVTPLGVRFIAAVCSTPVPALADANSKNQNPKDQT